MLLADESQTGAWAGHPGVEKRVAWIDGYPLAGLRATARTLGCTLNDLLLAAVSLAIVTIVAVFLVYMVLQTTQMIDRLDELFKAFDDNFTLSAYVGLPQVMSFAAIVAILNLVVVTVLGAVVAGIYNLAVKVTGGLLVGFMSN